MKAQIAIMMSDIQHDLGVAAKLLKDLQTGLDRLSAFLYDPKNIEAEKLVCEYTRNCCHFRANDCEKATSHARFVKVG